MEISEVENAIKCFDVNKLVVWMAYMRNNKRIVPLLAMCVTGLFVPGFLPSSFLSVVLVPIIK